MTDAKLQSYLDKYGPVAGPKLYRATQSRAAYIGATLRLRKALADRDANPNRSRRSSRPTPDPSQATLFEVAGSEAEPQAVAC